ncbi:MAG TPA: efflux RND transporter permease subunit [Planctomycetaceae bacterium]|nr:efflux RND transporter permease subunit [Planctomycetaceae bacterium]
MVRTLLRWLIRHPAAVITTAVLWAVVGGWVALHTPMDAVPDLSENQVLVSADWPGQNPPDIERRITRPLSLALQGLPGVRTVRGSSDVGYALLHVIFDDAVSFAEARERVGAQLAGLTVELPPSVTARLAADGIPTGQIFWYTVEGTGTDLVELRTLQDTVIAPQLRSIPGVAEVASVGGFVPEYHVAVDLGRLAEAQVALADFATALRESVEPATGQMLHSTNTEFLVRMLPDASGPEQRTDWQHRLEAVVLPLPDGRRVPLAQFARIALGTAPRRGVFEKDGNEAVAGIVHLRYGHNPLEVTRSVRERLRQIADGLPATVRLVPCYDRTPLIEGAVGTVTRTLIESLLVTSLCVLVVLRHWRTSLVITLTLPLAVLGAFLGMWTLRSAGLADVQTNIMSLAGIVVSIGVLVDSSIVVAENVTHQLRRRFGDQPVTGDVTDLVAAACATVAVPAFFAVLIMVVSFLPVFALQGIDGRMYRPLAWTKTLALLSVAVLTVTLVPVLCALLIRGRVRDESESAIVRSVVGVYRPVLSYLLRQPLPLAVLLGVTLIVASAATGVDLLVRLTAAASVVVMWWLAARVGTKLALTALMLMVALTAQSSIRPIGLALRLPLDEGMIMDMPITVPRVSVTQALDDLKARNMVLCRFPEVQMVIGKAGRAETPFDPAPLDMIETMVEFRPRDWWPSRRLLAGDAQHHANDVVAALLEAKLVEPPADTATLVGEIVDAGLVRFDAVQREVAWQRLTAVRNELARELSQQFVSDVIGRWARAGCLTQVIAPADTIGLAEQLPLVDRQRLGQVPDAETVHILHRELHRQLSRRRWLRDDIAAAADLRSSSVRFDSGFRTLLGLETVTLADDLLTPLRAAHARRWSAAVLQLNGELRNRAAATWTQIVCSELFARQPLLDADLTETWKQTLAARYGVGRTASHHTGEHTGLPPLSKLPIIDPHPAYDGIVRRLTDEFAQRVWLWPHDADSLTRPGGEMDRAVQMPGWANVWTRPIQNRVDMLATGVNSEVGIRVLGRDFEAVVQASERVAEALRHVPGAADVIADPIRGKSYVEVRPDPIRALQRNVALSDVNAVVAAAITGQVVGQLDDGSALRSMRLKIQGDNIDDRDALAQLPVAQRPSDDHPSDAPLENIALHEIADVRVADGPATIKSENGWLRNYVRLNVRGRDAAEFVAAAQRQVQQQVALPPGVFLEWTGQFEHAARTRRTMLWLAPLAVLLILAILYATYRDWADAGLMLLSVPGALAGGVLCQWLLGFPFTVAVGVGYIACFGMAAATSMVMLVYLREAVANAGGLERLSLDELRAAVLNGAVHRLRPKLLTEAATILSLAPMLWSTGVGADVIRPMAAPVLGGILIADEVVDLLLPIAFHAVRRWRWQRLRSQMADSLTKESA